MSFDKQAQPQKNETLILTEQITSLLNEAIEKTGKSKEEVILACLEHGLDRILERTGT